MSQNRTTTVPLNGSQPTSSPDPEVVPRAKRRSFTAAYKRRILQEADGCHQPGQIGALLRREGLYSSHLSKWRQQRKAGELQSLSGKKRGRNPKLSAAEKEMTTLRQENVRLQTQLEQAKLITMAQKKLLLALEQTLMAAKDGTV